MKRMGIRQTVAALTLFPWLLIVASMEFFFLHARFSDMDHDLLQHGKLVAHQLASISEYGVFANNQTFLRKIADSALQQGNVRTVIIQNSQADILVNVDNTHQPDLAEHTDEWKKLNALTPVWIGKKNLWIYQPIIPAQVVVDELEPQATVPYIGAILIEMSRLDIERQKSEILWFTVLVTMTLLIFPLYAIYLASKAITRPIRKLNDAVLQIAQGDLGTRVSITSSVSELSNLSNGINNMAEQLQQERSVLQHRIEDATQALRLKKDEAERASHDKSRFLAVASHDLRQPLHALGLYVTELQRNISDDKQHHLVGQIEQSIEALSALLNALLDISKLDAGVVVPHMQACNVNVVLDRITSDYQMLAQIKNIRLVVRSCAGYVMSDMLLLERILMNLVSNAIRYSHQNGCVLIACRRRGRFLRIEIRDNGIGIAKADQQNIFREFLQISQPNFNTHKGLGLGLAIVDRLVKLLGHRIYLRSAPDRGSVFALELPVANPPKATSINTQSSFLKSPGEEIFSNPLLGKRALVVDDDTMVLSGTASVLTSWGCIVETAESLEEVELFLQKGKSWDFFISDYQLSDHSNGFDVIAMIRGHFKRDVPCILISGDTSPEILKLAASKGHHLLHKPVRPAKLRSLAGYLVQENMTSSAG